MMQKWIDEQEAYNLGDTGFLICNSHETEGWSRYHLRDTPAHTNVSRVPRLVGWCGSYNNISTHACGVWKVVRVAKNGRMLITKTDADETLAFLEEMGYPDLPKTTEHQARFGGLSFWRNEMRKFLCWIGIHAWQITYWKIQCVKCQLLTCKHCGELDYIDDDRGWYEKG